MMGRAASAGAAAALVLRPTEAALVLRQTEAAVVLDQSGADLVLRRTDNRAIKPTIARHRGVRRQGVVNSRRSS
jgi:hypothetical protein